MPRSPVRHALRLVAAAALLACHRERPAPAGADAGAAVLAVDAAPDTVTAPLASSAVVDAVASPAIAATGTLAASGPPAPDRPPFIPTSRPSAIVQCKSATLARDAALGASDDRALDCPLAIGDRSQRPAWRGALDGPLTKQRRAVAGVAKDDCCYAMSAGAGGHRTH